MWFKSARLKVVTDKEDGGWNAACGAVLRTIVQVIGEESRGIFGVIQAGGMWSGRSSS